MFDKLAGIEERFIELEQLMADPEIVADYEQVVKYSKERSKIEDIVKAFRKYKSLQTQLAEAEVMLDDEDMRELAQMEIDEIKPQLPELEEALKVMLLPKDPRDDKNVIMEKG